VSPWSVRAHRAATVIRYRKGVHMLRSWKVSLQVTGICGLLGAVICAGQGETQFRVERSGGAYVVKYQDPDFDNRWSELRVPDAGRMRISLVSSIRPSGIGRWEYEYRVINKSDSAQSVLSWNLRVARGTEVLESPVGWRGHVSGNTLLPTLSWYATDGFGVPPGGTAKMSVISDSLPDVFEANVRGAPQTDYAAVDLPDFVRDRVLALEGRNGVPTYVVGPRIPTIGDTGEPIALTAILQSASATYRLPFLEKHGESAAASVGLQALDRLDNARAALERNDTTSAARLLREASGLLRSRNLGSDPTVSFADALAIVVEYVASRLH
jgi:hypothetical protein